MPWQSLGERIPVLTEWRDYSASSPPLPAAVEGITFRFTPLNIDTGEVFKTYALVRFRYDEGIERNYTRPFRIYPRPEPIIQVVPIPPNLSSAPFTWVPQVKKIVYSRFRGRSGELPWVLRIEDYLPEGGQSEAALEEQVAQISSMTRFLY